MKIISPAFADHQPIPKRFTCDNGDVNPPLVITSVPKNTKSLALIMDDPDAPAGTADPGWVHWLVYNIAPDTEKIDENSIPLDAAQGQNDWGKNTYGGPCPPSGTHRYIFTVYALNSADKLTAGLTKAELLEAINGRVLGSSALIGLYSRA